MTWKIKELTDKDHILTFLETDRLYAAYAIGDLEPGLFEQTAWFGADKDGQLRALAMHFRGVKMPVLFVMGDTEGIRAILGNGLYPGPFHINCRSEHMVMIQDIYRWDEPIAMWRMTLKKERFQPVTGNCTRLTPAHAEQMRNLYDYGGMPGFTEGQIDNGVFYGIFDNGRLIAAAGTHLVSVTYDVAAIGNVFTHPDHRDKGHGTAISSAVSVELVNLGIRDIILNVRQNNSSAFHIYEKLGFQCYCNFLEGSVSLH